MKKFHRILAFLLCLLLTMSFTAAEEAAVFAPLPEIILEDADPELIIEASAEPTPEPSVEATVEPTPEPSVEATVEPSPEPSAEATAGPSPDPSAEASAEPTPEPTIEATAEPTPEPSAGATVEPTPVPHPAMELELEALVLGVKEKYALEIRFTDGENYNVSYSSENTKLAKVNKKGVIIPLAVGETTIIAESEFGERIELPLTIKKAPYNLKLDTREVRLGAGQSYQLQLSMPEDCAGALKWINKKPRVASVDENGLITALSKGSTYIRIEAYNGKYASLNVRVYAAPEELALKDREITLGVGQTFALELEEALPQESYGFSCDHPEILSVNAKGELSALAVGEAVVTVESYNGLRDQCRVAVKPAPEEIAFFEKEIIICAKDSYTLHPLLMGDSEGIEVQLKSSTRRFKIKGNTITAASVGNGTLTATTYNGLTATVQLKCISTPKKIAFETSEMTLYMGENAVPALDADCNYTLESSNPELVAVDGRRIMALKPGDVQIKATSFNKKTAVLAVHVPPLPDSLALDETALALGCGDSCSLHPVLPAETGSSLHYESSDPAVASVDTSGRVEALAPGSATITVRTLNDLSAACAVTVYDAPSDIQLSPSRVVRSVEQGPFALEIRFGSEGQGGRYTIESSNPDVASVSHEGKITPIAPGGATITIQTYNGLSASARITLGEQPASMAFAEDIRVALGDSIHVAPQFDRGCESYTLESADPSIAALSGDSLAGLVPGTTTLRAVSASGLSAQCSVTVVAPPTGIALSHSEEKLVLGVHPTLQLTGNAMPDGVGSIFYRSSDPAIASVDANGLVTAHAMGDCVITATTYDGLHSAECAIHVRGVLDGVKIGIDPGHQREGDLHTETISPTSGRRKARTSHGTRGRATGIYEYETNLTISLQLRDALEAHGAEVHMTRTHHDVNISNQERAKMMNELGVDLVLRIHCNSAARSSARGMLILVRKTGVGKEESARAAQLILDAMLAETGAVNQGVKESDEYTGLNWSTVPCMLLELGYMSNYAEDRLLNSPDYQEKLVVGMVRGVCAYMDRPAPEVIIPIE